MCSQRRRATFGQGGGRLRWTWPQTRGCIGGRTRVTRLQPPAVGCTRCQSLPRGCAHTATQQAACISKASKLSWAELNATRRWCSAVSQQYVAPFFRHKACLHSLHARLAAVCRLSISKQREANRTPVCPLQTGWLQHNCTCTNAPPRAQHAIISAQNTQATMQALMHSAA